jgi:hypothetical protein
MSNFSDKRKLIVYLDDNKNNNIVDPLLLIEKSIQNETYSTQFYINKEGELKKTINKQNIKDNIIVKSYTENMKNPDSSLPYDNILSIYNIENYDELIIKIKELINENKSMNTVYRIVNLYTYLCYDILKKDNNTLIKILKIIFNKNINNNKINLFITEWFSKNNIDSFNLNICYDFNNFFSNE